MSEWLKQNKRKTILLVGVISNILIWSLYFSLPDGRLHLKVYDVGQGDSIFLETASGYRILVDGGPSNKVLGYLGKDLPFYSRRIDLLILTHPDADHITGLLEVIKQYKITSLWINGREKDTRLFEEWKKILTERKIPTKVVNQGNKIIFPDATQIEVLWPKEGYSSSNTNEGSIVISISFGNFDAILAGDADKSVQPYTSGLGAIEFLKVPHHGAKEALDEDFIRTIGAEISVISVGGDNRYGHPSEKTINILDSFGSKIYRTDKNGTVEIVSDGKSWYTRSKYD
jgi:competence protein ComEC